MTRCFALAALFALVGCSQFEDATENTSSEELLLLGQSAPPRNAGEELITRLTWAGTGGDQAAKGEFAPRDACQSIDGAYAFRIELAEAVLARDADAVAALASPDIKLSFGGDYGKDTLRDWLSAPDAELWQELEAVLPLGCAPEGEDWIVMPWYFAQDIGELDPYSIYFLEGENIPLYETRESDEPIFHGSWLRVLSLDYAVDFADRAGRTHVRLDDGREAYASDDDLRSLIDYRIGARRNEGGEWRVAWFLAGD